MTLAMQAILVQTSIFMLIMSRKQVALKSFFTSVLFRPANMSQILTSESMSLKLSSFTLGILGTSYLHRVRILIKMSKVFSSTIWLETEMLNSLRLPRRALSVSSNLNISSCSSVLTMTLCTISSVFLSLISMVMETVYFLSKVGRTISKGRSLLQGAFSFLGSLGSSFPLLTMGGLLSIFFICMGSTQLAYLRAGSYFSSYLRGGVLYAKENLGASSLFLRLQGLYSWQLLGLLLEGTGLSLFWELDRMEKNKRDEQVFLGRFKRFSY